MDFLEKRNLSSHLWDWVCQIWEEWDVQPSESSLLAGRVHPSQVSEVGVHRAGHDLGTDRSELGDPIVEGQDLRRTYESEVQWVEEEDEVLALEVRELQLLHLSVDDGGALPVRGRLGDQGLGPGQAMAGGTSVRMNGAAWKERRKELK